MTKELEKLYYLLTEAITNADGTNKPKNEHVSICYTDLQQCINEQEKKDELLSMYRKLIYKEETYITSDSFSQKMKIVEQLRELRLEIEALEEELK